MLKDLVKLKEWEKWRYTSMTTPQQTPLYLLTKEGAAARELLSEFLGCTPKYVLASYSGIYFKWEKTNKKFKADEAKIIGDVLLDKGYEAKIENTPKYLRISFGHATPIDPRERRTPETYEIHVEESYAIVQLFSRSGFWVDSIAVLKFTGEALIAQRKRIKNDKLVDKIVRNLKKRGLIPR